MHHSAVSVDQALEDEEINAEEFMYELSDDFVRRHNLETVASWEYETNITDETVRKMKDVAAENAKFYKVYAVDFILLLVIDEVNVNLMRSIGFVV